MSDEKKKFRKATEAIDLNLGGLLGNLGEVLGEAVQRLTQDFDASKETQSESGPIRTHTGLRVRVGGLATPGPKPVNSGRARGPETSATPKPEAETAPRSLECELIEDGAGWMVTAEMPGVAPSEVAVAVNGATLTLRTTGARRFQGEVTLPAPCPVEAITQNLVNGILTLRKGAA